MAATLVLKLKSEAVFESDLRSVWIFELGQKLTEIATFTYFSKEGIFGEKSYRSDFGKKKSSEKTEMIVWKFENLEEMSKWTRLFQ